LEGTRKCGGSGKNSIDWKNMQPLSIWGKLVWQGCHGRKKKMQFVATYHAHLQFLCGGDGFCL
jgi:hypothetical protein